MGNARRDDNHLPTLIAVSNVDGETPVTLWADPVTHRLLVSSGGTLDNLSDVVITSAAQGDILYHNGTNWVNLAAGTNGHVLTTGGAGANPSWTSTGGGGNTLDEAYDEGGAGSGRTIDVDSGAVALTVSNTDNNVVLTLAQNDTTNNPNVLELTTTGTGDHIVSVGTNETIRIQPSGTGNVELGTLAFDADQSVGAGTDNYVLTFNNSTGLISLEDPDPLIGNHNTLDEAYDEGGAGLGKSITADSGAVTITVPDASNNAGLTINQNDVTNNPIAATINNAGDGVMLSLSNTNAGNTGVYADFYHNSASPAVSDILTEFDFYGKDSSGNKTLYGYMACELDDPTDTQEDSTIEFGTRLAGTQTQRLSIGRSINGIHVGASSAAGIVSSFGNQDLTLQTGNTTTGTITITDGASGDITLAPNGTGIVKGTYHRMMVRLVDKDTALATDTTVGGDFRIANRAITVKEVGAFVDTAAATGTNKLTIDIHEAGTTIMTTNKITIDVGEKTSTTAATQPALTDTSIAADAIITFDVDQVNETTPAKGLTVWIDFIYA